MAYTQLVEKRTTGCLAHFNEPQSHAFTSWPAAIVTRPPTQIPNLGLVTGFDNLAIPIFGNIDSIWLRRAVRPGMPPALDKTMAEEQCLIRDETMARIDLADWRRTKHDG
jgi:hypothetical protein